MRLDRARARRAAQALGNRLRGPAYARATMPVEAVPEGAVVVHFAAVPAEIYQLEQWQYPLSRLAETRPVVVLVTRPDIGRLVTERTGLPVLYAPRGAQLERLVTERRPAVVLYVNHREPNFRMLRYPETVHVYLGHGESDKGASASHQNMAYDYCFVAGRAGQDRLSAALPLFDAAVRAPMVGRPNLDHGEASAAPPPGTPDAGGRTTLLYAPTWEGGLPSMAFGTVVSHGRALVDAALADPDIRLVYRPHPLTGTSSPAFAEADAALRQRIGEAGAPHVVDDGAYGWQLNAADVAVVDISSVAYDWLATGKPMLLTVPTDPFARPTPGRLSERATRLRADGAGDVVRQIRTVLGAPDPTWPELVEYHFGDTTPGASITRFLEAIEDVVRT